MRSDLILKSEAARVAGVTTRTISGWVRDGVLPYLTTPGRQRRFVADEVRKTAAREADTITPTQAINLFGVSARDLLAISMRAPILATRPHGGQRFYSKSALRKYLKRA